MDVEQIERWIAEYPPEDLAQIVSDLRELAGDGWIVANIAAELIERFPALLQLARAVSEAPRREVRECCGHLLVGNEWDEADAAIDAMRGQTVALVPVPVKEGPECVDPACECQMEHDYENAVRGAVLPTPEAKERT